MWLAKRRPVREMTTAMGLQGQGFGAGILGFSPLSPKPAVAERVYLGFHGFRKAELSGPESSPPSGRSL